MNRAKVFAVAGIALALVASPHAAEAKVAVGTLSCSSPGGVGFIVGSKKSYSCTFTRTNGAPPEYYRGSITNIGLDVGITGKTVLVWAVAASTADSQRPGILSGNYAGVAADASIGVGGGGKILVGGWRNSVTLQPLSAQAQAGLNIALGVSGLKLRQ
jgi:Protein of unknown function (DUF992)